MQRREITYSIFIVLLLIVPAFSSFGQVQINSVLAEGRWFKLAVTEDGIYRLDAAFLSNMGLSINSIDPRKIKIYGNGGKLLPQPNSLKRPIDLQENSIWVAGEADGSFDPNDYVIFYGQGPDTFTFNEQDRTLSYTNHTYSDTTFYFLTVDGVDGKRIGTAADPGIDHPIIDYFVDYQVHEKDGINLLNPGSGREWYEAIFSITKSREFKFSFPGLKTDKPVKVTSHVLANSQNTSTIDISLNGTFAGQHQLAGVPGTTYSSRASESIEEFTLGSVPDPGDQSVTVTLDYDGEKNGYLNYLLVSAYRDLEMVQDSALFFQTWESLENGLTTYAIGSTLESTRIWNITDHENIEEQPTQRTGDEMMFGDVSDSLKRYVAFNPEVVKTPLFEKEIANQDLHGTVHANLVIITYSAFRSEAERLADLRRSHDGLSVVVVDPEQIYNEFSSGSQDVSAIRDFLKYLWDIDHSSSGLKYALLFGKSSYDFKDRLANNTNFVPTYESYNSLHPIFSYSSDDYFGFMEDDEGEWRENGNGDHTMDIGVGRFPVTTIEEARVLVDKYYTYSLDNNTYGSWKNTISFVADDGDNNLHQRQADRLADTVERFDYVFNKKKIYLDAFPQEVIPGGETSKETYDFLKQTINDGTFIVNFTGHGGERQWTDERILDFLMIEQWENAYKYPIFITATCEFGRHDDPEMISGAEKALLREKGGAIAMVTTARPVFATQNFELNSAFYNALLGNPADNIPTLGNVFKETKNNSLSGSVNRNFALLGDPSLKIAIPALDVSLDSIQSSGVNIDTLKALSKINLSGSIRDRAGNLKDDFSGEVDIILFEKPSQKMTLGSKDDVFEYEERDNILFKGKSSVNNGVFKSEFIIPKNISYKYGKGKFSFYAYNMDPGLEARGGSLQFDIGGSAENIEPDVSGPGIAVYLGDTTFHPGGTIKPNTILVARISDESGINISKSGLGQNIQAILDNSETFLLNDYFESDLDNFKSGWVQFPIRDLNPGPHHITVKAWDAFNNPGEASIDFFVSEKGELVLERFRNYPNPFSERTSFTFEHNRPGEDLDVKIQIFNSNGEIVKLLEYDLYGSLTNTPGIEWDGRNSAGSKLRPGIYFCKMIVRSNLDGASNLLYQKIIIY